MPPFDKYLSNAEADGPPTTCTIFSSEAAHQAAMSRSSGSAPAGFAWCHPRPATTHFQSSSGRSDRGPGEIDGESSGGGAAFHIDVETDPTAFILSGYSLHAGEARGAFVAADAGAARLSVAREDSNRRAERAVSSAGVQVGYRFSLSSRRNSPSEKPTYRPFEGAFYVTPWIGVGYLFGTTPIEADGKSFNLSPVSVFPAVHVGYGFD